MKKYTPALVLVVTGSIFVLSLLKITNDFDNKIIFPKRLECEIVGNTDMVNSIGFDIGDTLWVGENGELVNRKPIVYSHAVGVVKIGYIDGLIQKFDNNPPCFNSGFELEQMIVDARSGHIAYLVKEGKYFKLSLESAEEYFLDVHFHFKDILYANRMIFVYLKDGKICHELDNITNPKSNNFMPLWAIKVNIHDGDITIEEVDWRGNIIDLKWKKQQ